MKSLFKTFFIVYLCSSVELIFFKLYKVLVTYYGYLKAIYDLEQNLCLDLIYLFFGSQHLDPLNHTVEDI